MKTLIFNGSPREDGCTAYLTNLLRENIAGEVREVRAYSVSVGTNNESYGYVSGGGLYESGSPATVYAWPYSQYRFVRWAENDATISTDPLFLPARDEIIADPGHEQ